ncbi:hypothetical protein CsSME_00006553 [Camellia sinensis var. sinensis]
MLERGTQRSSVHLVFMQSARASKVTLEREMRVSRLASEDALAAYSPVLLRHIGWLDKTGVTLTLLAAVRCLYTYIYI